MYSYEFYLKTKKYAVLHNLRHNKDKGVHLSYNITLFVKFYPSFVTINF